MKRLFLSVFAVMLVGCDPSVSVFRWESNPEYRGFISTRMAEAIMNTPVVVDEEEEVEELCDGSGWIVHGDGHKTPCPGCEACEKKDGQEPVEIIVDAVEDCPDGQCPAPSFQSQPQRRGLLKRIFGR